ncbi:hypothetical protein QVD17_32269 [Tagetes erecta]|uniref:Uncharacterized protein n=1 Tax=Tagetes erecta TaxID=13708 RepID=A0AAD8NQ27_TARER|nr:hypothetical protein QVD17_32269 [Tagetes erecta]
MINLGKCETGGEFPSNSAIKEAKISINGDVRRIEVEEDEVLFNYDLPEYLVEFDFDCFAFHIGSTVGGQLAIRDQDFHLSPVWNGSLNAKEDDNEIPIDQLLRMNPKNIHAGIMNEMMEGIRTSRLMILDKAIMHIATQDQAEIEAGNAAQKIFDNIAKPDFNKEALKKIGLFNGASGISKETLENWVIKVFRTPKKKLFNLKHVTSQKLEPLGKGTEYQRQEISEFFTKLV